MQLINIKTLGGLLQSPSYLEHGEALYIGKVNIQNIRELFDTIGNSKTYVESQTSGICDSLLDGGFFRESVLVFDPVTGRFIDGNQRIRGMLKALAINPLLSFKVRIHLLQGGNPDGYNRGKGLGEQDLIRGIIGNTDYRTVNGGGQFLLRMMEEAHKVIRAHRENSFKKGFNDPAFQDSHIHDKMQGTLGEHNETFEQLFNIVSEMGGQLDQLRFSAHFAFMLNHANNPMNRKIIRSVPMVPRKNTQQETMLNTYELLVLKFKQN